MMQDRQVEPTEYEIRVSGHLDLERAVWFGELALTVEHTAGGTAITVLSGPVVDGAALFGVLNRIRDLGLTLISVHPRSAARTRVGDSRTDNKSNPQVSV